MCILMSQETRTTSLMHDCGPALTAALSRESP